MEIKKRYIAASIILFLFGVILVTILRYSGFVRGFTGDIMVVMFLVTVIKSFKNWKTEYISAGIFLFAVFVEITQYFGLIKILGLAKSYAAQLIFGGVFDWLDFLAYFIGAVFIVVLDKRVLQKIGGKNGY